MTDSTALLLRWTRDGTLRLPWSPFETLDRLVLSPPLRDRLKRTVDQFLSGRDAYRAMKLPWRYGLFLFGAPGAGKSAAARGISRALGWNVFAISAHQILDAHLFERATTEAVTEHGRVIVLEDVDLFTRRMDPSDFFTILDHALERAEGTFWIATTRHPENTPKSQLVRPGRFDEAIKLDSPGPALRRDLLMNLLVPFFSLEAKGEASFAEGADEKTLTELAEKTEGLSYAHFEELRQIIARAAISGNRAEIWLSLESYISDQVIAGDRMGGISDMAHELEQRVAHVDPRVLMAALDMTDVFTRLMDKVIGDAAEEAKLAEAQGD